MAGKIRGITVEIGGDTTKLGNALKDSEAKSKSLKSELKEVQTALKFNPGNIELLTQKQRILSDQIEATADKLKTLKEADKQVAQQFESGEIGQEQYDAFRREVIQTESKLQTYESQLAQTETEIKNLGNSTDQAANDTEQFEKDLKTAEGTLNDVKEAASDLAGTLGTIGGAMVAGGTYAIDAATDMTSAMNSLQAQTGFTDNQMVLLEGSLENLYKNNYGESLEQLANCMARVAQATGETDPVVLEDMTKNLIVLEDTFEMDFNETLRGVDGLMKNMGLTSQQAFDLIAKGAQNGLNKSDELGDNLAEYTQLWGQAGFSAEEMFAILDNGLSNGAYNLDKVNDFVKEFTISLSDGRIEENLKSFSKETQTTFNEWKKGKKTSADVFKSVINDLKNTENQQEALTTASTVWSALGEDNAMKIITSLTDVNDTYAEVAGTMESINEIKYDDVKNRFEALGRTIQTDVAAPLGEKLLPVAEKFISYCSNNLDEVVSTVAKVGAAFATIFVVNKVANFTQSIVGLITNFKTLGTVLAANPIAAFATAVTAAGVAIATLGDYQEKQIEKTWGLSDAEKELNARIAETSENLKAKQAVQAEANAGIEAEIGHCQNLWTELQNIVDANGKIKAGYEDRAAVITGQLASALGIEIEIVGNQISAYEELKASIEDVIATKRAEALLDVNKGAYTEAIQKQSAAYQDIVDKEKQVADSKAKLTEAEKAYADALEWANSVSNPVMRTERLNSTWDEKKAVEEATKAHEKNVAALETANETYLTYQNTISNYEGVMAAVANGDVGAMTTAMDKLSNSFVTAENATKEMLQNQLTSFQTQYDAMKTAVEQGMPGVSQAQVDQMANMVNLAQAELDKLTPKAEESGKTAITSFNGALASLQGPIKTTGENISNSANEGLGTADTAATGLLLGEQFTWQLAQQEHRAKKAGEKNSNSANAGLGSADTTSTGSKAGSNFASGVSSQSGNAQSAGQKVSNSAKTGMGKANTTPEGKQVGIRFKAGISSQNGTVLSAGEILAQNAKTGVSSVNATSAGSDFAKGFEDGMEGGRFSIIEKAKQLALSALEALRNALDEHSPSEETKEAGEFFTEGFGIGISKGEGEIEERSTSIAETALTPLAGALTGMTAINSEMLDNNTAFWKAMEKNTVNGGIKLSKATEETTDTIAENKEDLTKKLQSLNKTYENDVKSVQTTLVKEIQAVTDAYDKAVESRQKQITASMGLFSDITLDEGLTGEDITNKLRDQVNALDAWDTALDTLSNREGMDSNLLAELQGMGPQALLTIQSLTRMSDAELAEYIGLYQKKSQIALERSQDENAQLLEDTQAQIMQLTENAKTDLQTIEDTYVAGLKELGIDVNNQSREIGVNIVDGLKTGIVSKQAELQSFLTTFFNSLVLNAKTTLDINSPSKVFADEVGEQIPAGVAEGVTNNADTAEKAVRRLFSNLTDHANSFNKVGIERNLIPSDGVSASKLRATENTALLAKLDGIYERLGRLQVVLNNKTLVGEIIDDVDTLLANKQLLAERGV